ncbi:hypothetical protein M8J76_015963 [Diaphorina citri]|nr:hypothetical protein M8J76_015963 [Diaphorina citri]
MEYEDYFLEEDKIYMTEMSMFNMERDMHDYSRIQYTPLDTWQWLLTDNHTTMSPEDRILLDDYLQGLNQSIEKLMDKEQAGVTKENPTGSEGFKSTSGTTTTKTIIGASNLVLLIDDSADQVLTIEDIGKGNDIKQIDASIDINKQMDRHMDKPAELETNTGTDNKVLETNTDSKSAIKGKDELKTFIANMDKVNQTIDKIVSKDRAGNVPESFKDRQECRKNESTFKNERFSPNVNETKERTSEKTEINTKIEETADLQRNSYDNKDKNDKSATLTNDTESISNLTVLEQTYTIEDYHKRYERRCRHEMKALEQVVLEKSHGVHECNAELHEDQYNSVPYEYQNYMGMTVTSGIVTIAKDSSNLIGISIGGGAPLCPCLYIVQEGTLQSGDEVVGVNGACVKGKTKVEVAKMIQSVEREVSIKYNKLHADPQQGKSLDIVLKKVKHRLVENMSTTTADALGLSRAILCNDTLVKKMEELENTEQMYKGLVEHCKKVLKGFLGILRVYKDFGDAFAGIGVREPQPRASEAFRQFGEYHRQMEKNGIATIKAVKPILSDLGTYLNKAIPDTKLTIRKYADTKFEYLSYCLKVKEMDDEEYSYAALQEPLYRVETGNYEYRLILRCRQDARLRFAALRSDVLVKLELLDNKHVQDVVCQLQRLIAGLASYHSTNIDLLRENSLFPIEMDLSRSAFQYECNQVPSYDNSNEEDDQGDDELIMGEEAKPDGEVEDKTQASSEYNDLLKEFEQPSNTTNLLDL